MNHNKISTNKATWKRFAFFLILIAVCSQSCKKLVEVDPPGNNLNAANVFSNDATAIAAVTGVYTNMSNLQNDLTSNSMVAFTLYGGLSADELTLFNLNKVTLLDYYRNNLSATTSGINGATFLWNVAYDHIYTVNGAIEGLNGSNALTPAVKQHLLGEAKFIRAFCYFYLTNLYGNVPLILTTNWQNNASATSASQADIYKQIAFDLKDAKDLLTDNYLASDLVSTSIERIRPNKGAAEALLARTYLYTKDWSNAEAEASTVINAKTQYDTVNLSNGVFTKNSKETIWGLQPVRNGTASNTGDGALFILPSTGPDVTSYPVYLSNNVINSFEAGDLRKKNWVDSVKPAGKVFYYTKKYKIGKVATATQEYEIVIRLAEIYLIRAEARAQQNNLQGAIADIDVVRKRAGLPLIANTNPGISQSALLTTILHERQIELFTEWGHRWLDLKRTNTIDNIMSIVTPQKAGSWSSYKALFPIPYSETQKNQNLDQNFGY